MKRIALAIVVFFAVLVPLVSYAFKQEKVYEARSLILFALGWEFVYVPEPNQVGVKAPNPGDFGGFVNAEMLLLDNPQLIGTAIEKVGLNRIFPDLPNDEAGMRQATLNMDNATRVELITGSYVVKVAVRHKDPVIAADFANALSDAFLDMRRSLYADREVDAVTTRLAAASKEAEAVDAEITSIVGVPDIGPYEARLDNAIADQARLETELSEISINLVGLEQRYKSLENVLGQEAERREAQVLISENEARRDYIREQLDASTQSIKELSAIMPQLRLLSENQARHSERVAELEIRLRDAQTVATAGFDNVRVIERGVPPLRSISMTLKTQLAISIMVALIAAVAAYVIAHLFKSGGFSSSQPSGSESASVSSLPKSKIWVGGNRDNRRAGGNDTGAGTAWPAQ